MPATGNGVPGACMRATRRLRAGVSLIEIMVVLAVMGVVLAIGLPSMNAIFDVQQRGAARDLAQTFRFLQDEAAMRNVSFRVSFNLDANSYRIEVGDANTLAFGSPEERESAEREQEAALSRLTRKEKEEGAAQEGQGRFEGLNMAGFASDVTLPEGTVYAWAWTPQYATPVTPNEEPPEKPEDARVVYAYVFPSGESEHVAVRVVDVDDPEDGYTVEVAPMSGAITVDAENHDIGEGLAWIPTEAPTIR